MGFGLPATPVGAPLSPAALCATAGCVLPCSVFFGAREVTAWMGTVSTLLRLAVAMDTDADRPGNALGGGSWTPMRTKKVVTSASVPGFLICAFLPTDTTLPLNCLSGMASISIVA